MRILITGGAGFIGSHIAEELSKDNEVVILDNLSTGKKENIKGMNVKLIKGDIRNENDVEKAMKKCDYVLHLAAVASVVKSIENPEETFDVNINGTLKLLKAAVKHRIKKIVFSSSCAVYGSNEKMPKTELMLPEPLSPYAVSKETSEQLMRMFFRLYKLPFTNLRYFNVYGPRQDSKSEYSGVIAIFIDRALKNKTLTVFGNPTRDFVYVKDVVKANIKAMLSSAVGTFNICTGKETSIIYLAKMIKEITKSDSRIEYKPQRKGDIIRIFGDNAKAGAFLKWKPETELENGLRETISFFSN